MSLPELFQTMEIRRTTPANLKASEWLSNFNKNSTDYVNELRFTGDYDLPKIISDVTKQRDSLTAVLAATMFVQQDAETCMDMILDDLKYFLTNEKPSCGLNTLVVRDFNLYFMGKYIGGFYMYPGWTSSNVYCFDVFHEKCLPFVTFLLEVVNCRFFKLTFSSYPASYEIKQCFSPALIFEDADLDSAINSLIPAICSYNGEAISSVTHIFIQESIFDQATNKLKMRMMKELSVNKNNFIYLKNDSILKDPREEKLNVYLPSEEHDIRLLIGFDADEVKLQKQRIDIALVPFRTVVEGLTLANDKTTLTRHIGGSIWTENVSLAQTAPNQLQLSIVWVNCHGILTPEVMGGNDNCNCKNNTLFVKSPIWESYNNSIQDRAKKALPMLAKMDSAEVDRITSKIREMISKYSEDERVEYLSELDVYKQKYHTKNTMFRNTRTTVFKWYESKVNVLLVTRSHPISEFLFFVLKNFLLRNSLIISSFAPAEKLLKACENVKDLLPPGAVEYGNYDVTEAFFELSQINIGKSSEFDKHLMLSKTVVYLN